MIEEAKIAFRGYNYSPIYLELDVPTQAIVLGQANISFLREVAVN